MRRLIATLILCASLFHANDVLATHAAGAELVYELVPGTTNQYKFTYKFYRDCAGAATAPTSVTMCYGNNCGANGSITLNSVPTLPGGAANGTPVGTGCPGFPTTCSGGTLPGYQEWWYSNTLTLPTTCSLWRFSVTVNARNNAILN
ncbi:MAG TPA: hypothetical protein PLP14_07870, partial [Chitinophagaceae bacterium]|nr:hypothetical protein [Chitinophagaceae bacterium]